MGGERGASQSRMNRKLSTKRARNLFIIANNIFSNSQRHHHPTHKCVINFIIHFGGARKKSRFALFSSLALCRRHKYICLINTLRAVRDVYDGVMGVSLIRKKGISLLPRCASDYMIVINN